MDILTVDARSERMKRVRSKGNRSTEWRLRATLIQLGLRGWRLHQRELPGCPDFVFADTRLAIFVDGCFWHRCPKCQRRMPKAREAYWREKIEGNVLRAKRVHRSLHRLGYKVLRVWEHELRDLDAVAKKIRGCLS
jgi:DNA mismatch endonuclease, patch repair protein